MIPCGILTLCHRDWPLYDDVFYKLSKNMPHWFVRLIELFLRNRPFRVHIGDDTSTWRTHVNGLPQGSVLSPTLFNLYTNDLPVTRSRKFIYADDICLTKQAQRYAELECLKQLPACFIYSTPVQPVSLGYTWRANNSGMSPIQYTLG